MSDTHTLTLDAMITLSSVDHVYQLAKEALAAGASHIIIDARQVERLCTPVFQLLLSLKSTLAGQNRTLDIQDPSDPFITMLAYLGLHDLLINEVPS